MIVGTDHINTVELVQNCKSKEMLIQYAWRLVPSCARHISAIVDNQKYLVAMEVRQLNRMDYTKRTELAEALLDGIHVCGVINSIVSIEDIFLNIDADVFFREIFREVI